MPPIFVDTENTNPENKLFNGAKAGKASAQAEEKMKKAVVKIIGKAPDFTTNKTADGKGYAIRLVVAKVEVSGQKTTCSLSGDIVRRPREMTKKRGEGEEMVSTSMKGNGSVDGTSDRDALDCIEAIAEDLVAKSLPAMRKDWVSR